jgi:hypothetical protein
MQSGFQESTKDKEKEKVNRAWEHLGWLRRIGIYSM